MNTEQSNAVLKLSSLLSTRSSVVKKKQQLGAQIQAIDSKINRIIYVLKKQGFLATDVKLFLSKLEVLDDNQIEKIYSAYQALDINEDIQS